MLLGWQAFEYASNQVSCSRIWSNLIRVMWYKNDEVMELNIKIKIISTQTSY